VARRIALGLLAVGALGAVAYLAAVVGVCRAASAGVAAGHAAGWGA
jgi:hypothetical protein